MLPNDAFLRRLPESFNGAQAIQLEALLFSADSAEFSYDEIKSVSLEHRQKILVAPPTVRTRMFIHAWNIVDSLHVIRQVIHALNIVPSAGCENFRDKYEVATKMRNKMDHLSQNATNISRSSAQAPIYGSIGYVCIQDHDIEEVDGNEVLKNVGVVSMSSGRLVGQSRIGAINPLGRTMTDRTSLFQLEAFGEVLLIEDAIADLKKMIFRLNNSVEKGFRNAALEISAKKGLSIEELSANPVVNLTMYITMKLKDDIVAR
ncbi:hypothetical protein [Mesorhizobium sp. M0643]|uniref:hypothetical protein n=1 Tax=Mesorhizobium sp. M0643 TaxID=2956978 RepID=UPI003338B1BE